MSFLSHLTSFGNRIPGLSKTLGLNKEKKSYVNMWQYKYAFDVARKPTSLTELRDEILKSPEVLSRLLTIIDDVLPGYEIVCKDDALKEKVEDKLIATNFFRELHSAYLDFLLTGDGYLEPVFVREKDVDLILNGLGKIDIYKDLQPIDYFRIKSLALKQNPELYEPTDISWVLSDYLYKKIDKHGTVEGYKQIINGQVAAKWNYEQLINFSAYKAKSEIYGFTPLLTFLDDLVLLKDTKLYIKNFFENNGVPDYIIGLKDSKGPKDPAFAKLKEVMKKRREDKKRGSLVVSGELFVEALNYNRDMDFSNLLGYLCDTLDHLWRIPPQKLGSAQAGSDKRGANAVLRPYYARIKKEQKFLEDVLNSMYFNHFGLGNEGKVTIKLSNSSSVDQVVDSAWTSLMYNDGVLSISEYRGRMGLASDAPNDLEENPHFMTKDEMQEKFNQEQEAFGSPDAKNPNKGPAQNNQANPNKTPKQEAKNK